METTGNVISEILSNLAEYAFSPDMIPDPYKGIIALLRVLFLGVSFFFFAIIVFVHFKSQWIKERAWEDANEFINFKSFDTDKIAKEWKKILKKMDSGLESEYKLAIIEADGMFDNILRLMGHTEETVEEKLKKVSLSEIPNIEELKAARKTRNNIVYDPDYNLSLDKAKEALSIYEKTFKNLNVL